jgi:hypothetical protein
MRTVETTCYIDHAESADAVDASNGTHWKCIGEIGEVEGLSYHAAASRYVESVVRPKTKLIGLCCRRRMRLYAHQMPWITHTHTHTNGHRVIKQQFRGFYSPFAYRRPALVLAS